MEEARGKVDQNHVAMDTGGNSGQPSRPTTTQTRHGSNKGELATGEQEATLTTGEGAPAQVQTTLDNWYTVQMRRRRRLKGSTYGMGEGM
jgi:hypothetical protein